MRINSIQDWWNGLEAINADVETILGYVDMDTRIDEFRALQKDKTIENGKLIHGILNDAWFAAPDHPMIHTWPNWSNFCDLCSENWVFYEVDADNDNDNDNAAAF